MSVAPYQLFLLLNNRSSAGIVVGIGGAPKVSHMVLCKGNKNHGLTSWFQALFGIKLSSLLENLRSTTQEGSHPFDLVMSCLECLQTVPAPRGLSFDLYPSIPFGGVEPLQRSSCSAWRTPRSYALSRGCALLHSL